MRSDLTEVVIVVDRSGSMHRIREDAEGAVNGFIEEQRKDGDVLLTIVQFDDQHDLIADGVPIHAAGRYTLSPRGMTALFDAVGSTINIVGDRLARTNEADRPGLVIFAICTDGLENASREFTRSQVAQMVEHQKAKYNWQFIYLGANQDALKVGREIGTQVAANFSGQKIGEALKATTRSTRDMKQQLALGEFVVNKGYTDKELSEMV